MSSIFSSNEVIGFDFVVDPALNDIICETPAPGVPFNGTYRVRFMVTHTDPTRRLFAALIFRGGAWAGIGGLGPEIPILEMKLNLNAGELLGVSYPNVNASAGVGTFGGMISYSLIAGTPPFV